MKTTKTYKYDHGFKIIITIHALFHSFAFHCDILNKEGPMPE